MAALTGPGGVFCIKIHGLIDYTKIPEARSLGDFSFTGVVQW